MTAADEGHPSGTGRVGTGILVILIASCALKVALLLYVGDIRPVGDEEQYIHAGRSIAAGNGIRYTNPKWDPLYQPPVYPYVMGLVYANGGDASDVKLLQILLSTFTVWLVFLLARDWYDARTATWSAALFAFYPTLVAFTHLNWSETVFTFWLVAAFYFLFEPGQRIAGPTSLLFAGVLLGMAAQTRAVATYIVPCFVPLVYVGTRDVRATLGRGAALVLGFAIAIAPLTVSIWREHGGFLLISTQPAKIWHESYNSREPGNVDYGFDYTRDQPNRERPRSEEPNPVVRQRVETANALAFIAENPLLCAKRFWVRLTFLFNPSSFLVRHLRDGHYDDLRPPPHRGPVPRAAVELVVAVTVASYLLVATFGLLGLFTMPRGLVRTFSVGIILFFATLSALTYATSRYRVPFLPVLMPSAAYALTHLRSSVTKLREPRVGIPFAVVYAVLLHWWSLYLAFNWR